MANTALQARIADWRTQPESQVPRRPRPAQEPSDEQRAAHTVDLSAANAAASVDKFYAGRTPPLPTGVLPASQEPPPSWLDAATVREFFADLPRHDPDFAADIRAGLQNITAARLHNDDAHSSYRVSWSTEDAEFAATCDEFPSLSWLAASPVGALTGLVRLIAETVADMQARGDTSRPQ